MLRSQCQFPSEDGILIYTFFVKEIKTLKKLNQRRDPWRDCNNNKKKTRQHHSKCDLSSWRYSPSFSSTSSPFVSHFFFGIDFKSYFETFQGFRFAPLSLHAEPKDRFPKRWVSLQKPLSLWAWLWLCTSFRLHLCFFLFCFAVVAFYTRSPCPHES